MLTPRQVIEFVKTLETDTSIKRYIKPEHIDILEQAIELNPDLRAVETFLDDAITGMGSGRKVNLLLHAYQFAKFQDYENAHIIAGSREAANALLEFFKGEE